MTKTNTERAVPIASGSILAMLAAAALLVSAPGHFARAQTSPEAETSAEESGYAELDGARIYYQTYGALDEGTPLLVLHGAFMSSDAMRPLIERFAASRPVIALDARGHGRTGDAEGGLTYERFADDAVAVLDTLSVETADVFGYSMGGNTAVMLALRHPDRVGKQVIVSATFARDGWYPEVLEGIAQMTPDVFDGTAMKAEYQRLSPTPDAFSTLVEEIKALEELPFAPPQDALRAIPGKTMIIIGDADGIRPEHAVEMFELRGGGDVTAATQGFLTEPPQARLAILPATSHIGALAEPDLIEALVTPFLNDATPPMPEGFFESAE